MYGQGIIPVVIPCNNYNQQKHSSNEEAIAIFTAYKMLKSVIRPTVRILVASASRCADCQCRPYERQMVITHLPRCLLRDIVNTAMDLLHYSNF